MNFILDLVNPDNIPDGYSTIDISKDSFIFGMIVGFFISILIALIVKIIKDLK